ncbi:GMC oxidoreductase-domain-containing protein [Xylariaceae sp. AK1471]|nr:GMC oxidoreductase-domain-containing protein [Xylariaceae sp. AK1471]
MADEPPPCALSRTETEAPRSAAAMVARIPARPPPTTIMRDLTCVVVVVDSAWCVVSMAGGLAETLNFQVAKQEEFEPLDGLLQGDRAAVAAAQEALVVGRGPLTGVNTTGSAQMTLPNFASEAGRHELDQLFQRSGEEPASALYTLFPGCIAFDENGDLLPHPGDGVYLTFAICLAHPLSRGWVHITSASPSCDLQIDPNYFSHPADIEVLARHVQAVENIKRTEPLAHHFIQGGKRIPPEGDLSDLDVAREYARKGCRAAYNFTGTCSQMPREMGGVVDEKCRVYGCKNLRVCDLSIVPIIPRSNTQATAYGVAEHAAKIVKADLLQVMPLS